MKPTELAALKAVHFGLPARQELIVALVDQGMLKLSSRGYQTTMAGRTKLRAEGETVLENERPRPKHRVPSKDAPKRPKPRPAPHVPQDSAAALVQGSESSPNGMGEGSGPESDAKPAPKKVSIPRINARALSKLPTRERVWRVLLVRTASGEGMNVADDAELIGVTSRTVRTQLSTLPAVFRRCDGRKTRWFATETTYPASPYTTPKPSEPVITPDGPTPPSTSAEPSGGDDTSVDTDTCTEGEIAPELVQVEPHLQRKIDLQDPVFVSWCDQMSDRLDELGYGPGEGDEAIPLPARLDALLKSVAVKQRELTRRERALEDQVANEAAANRGVEEKWRSLDSLLDGAFAPDTTPDGRVMAVPERLAWLVGLHHESSQWFVQINKLLDQHGVPWPIAGCPPTTFQGERAHQRLEHAIRHWTEGLQTLRRRLEPFERLSALDDVSFDVTVDLGKRRDSYRRLALDLAATQAGAR